MAWNPLMTWRILSAQFCERWAKRCVNIHPSLLPAFAGGMDLQVHEAVLAGSMACLETFVEFQEMGADLAGADNEGLTPAHLAAQAGRTDMRALLNRQA